MVLGTTGPAGVEAERDAGSALADAHSLGEYVLRRLRMDVISTRLKPGSKLRLRELSKLYGVGVSPLRDALSQLAGDGLVILESQRGFWVAPVSRADMRDVADTRRRLELMALELALDRGDATWDARIVAAYREFEPVKQRVGDQQPITEDWETRHRALHVALLSACGSPTLLRFCRQIHDRFHRYRRLALPTRSFMGALGDDHGDIMESVLHRDKARSLSLLDQHIASSSRLIEDNLDLSDPPRPRHGGRPQQPRSARAPRAN